MEGSARSEPALIMLAYADGDWESAEDVARPLLDSTLQFGNMATRSSACTWLAQNRYARGDLQDADHRRPLR